MDEEATHRTAGRVQEEGAIPVVQHQEMGRQHLEAQSTLLILQQIVVEALTRNVKEDHVREIFGKYGTIKELRMPMNPTFNINRGIAYILYEEIDDAERAIAKMHDAQLDGAKIQVSIVLPRRRFSQTPPPARRGPPPRDDYDGGYGRGGRALRGGGPPGAYRPPPMDGPSRYRSPPRRMSPDRGHWGRGRGGGGRGGRGGYSVSIQNTTKTKRGRRLRQAGQSAKERRPWRRRKEKSQL
ncbi:hypothetical protein GT037_001025 [Alternaria burnsii]|uniref:RRM domain-containing protein n=1 Tax=Alternaria burnsii TaxID=1187904 RepID=A0A8H7BEA5_9PLEO|nr:uncharacterized protein GT037_001025 [Alternaria burnsii]KAF7682049.1 hypothetical protein GT037_001025 [Alternaria burnsii]